MNTFDRRPTVHHMLVHIWTPGCAEGTRGACGVISPLVIKAPIDQENCHLAEFRYRTHRAPPSVEPGRWIGLRPTDAAGLRRAPPSRPALYAPGAAQSYAAGDVAGERGLSAADRRQSRRMA